MAIAPRMFTKELKMSAKVITIHQSASEAGKLVHDTSFNTFKLGFKLAREGEFKGYLGVDTDEILN